MLLITMAYRFWKIVLILLALFSCKWSNMAKIGAGGGNKVSGGL